MLVPLYAFLQEDTLGLVILVQDTDSMTAVAANLQQAACMRVAPRQGMRVRYNGKLVPPERSVAEAGMGALDRIDVVAGETS
ncbi:MAG: hypothetical protein EPO06_02080 [Burkholderiaceae bacterium]|nr:MAG: hypothetical protein EPO06_02080 [Burkholderiaceae bacterium]